MRLRVTKIPKIPSEIGLSALGLSEGSPLIMRVQMTMSLDLDLTLLLPGRIASFIRVKVLGPISSKRKISRLDRFYRGPQDVTRMITIN
jgi:hypothetical protein